MKKPNPFARLKQVGPPFGQEFYLQGAAAVAQQLLGHYLGLLREGQLYLGLISETEAYLGPEDRASHAFANHYSQRTAPMFARGGHLYVYLIYGLHHCLNIVTGRQGFPAAVLIRGLYLILPQKQNLDGPGKICRHLGIDRRFNYRQVGQANSIFIRRNLRLGKKKVRRLPRVGVAYAQDWAQKPLRFQLQEPNLDRLAVDAAGFEPATPDL